MSKFDSIYRSILLSKFFVKGWGKPNNLKRILEFRKVMSDRNKCQQLVSADYPVYLDKETKHSNYTVLDGHFKTPFSHYLPDVIPEETLNAKFQIVLPKKWKCSLQPMVVHLAGTGDHGFWRRRKFMAAPLLKEGNIGSIILENPFYGSRKPKGQLRSSLHNVSDLFVMGICLILESLVMFHWCERHNYGPLGITGISLGGHMASVAGSNWHKPLAIVPCLSWTTASCAFTQGVLKRAIPWNVLETQYLSDSVYAEIKKLINSPEQYNDTNTLDMELSTEPSGSHLRNEALKFMQRVMDECTHIGNYSVPVDPNLCMVVAATCDQYIPREGLRQITDYWPGAEVRYIDQGHVASYVFHHNQFRKAIIDTFAKMINKYYSNGISAPC